LSADYPGALVDEFVGPREHRWCFLPPALSEMQRAQRPAAATAQQSAHLLGAELAADLRSALATARYDAQATLASYYLDVELPPFRVPVSYRWRLSRFAPIGWLNTRLTCICCASARQYCSASPATMRRLVRSLTAQMDDLGLTLVPTSFQWRLPRLFRRGTDISSVQLLRDSPAQFLRTLGR